MFIVKNRKIFFIISGLLVLVSLFFVFTKGLKLGIDFTGGSLLEIEYLEKQTDEVEAVEEVASSTVESGEKVNFVPEQKEVLDVITATGVEGVLVQKTGDAGFLIRTKSISEVQRRDMIESLNFEGIYTVEEKRFNSIGPVIGKELREKAWLAIITVIIAIILFIAFVFRHVSRPVQSWKYGVIAIVALIHDILIPAGIVALLGLEIDSLFVIALLAILGLSVNDTIVVFDRIRENLKLEISNVFSETVGKSLQQTFVRSLNTSITTLFVVSALFFLGPETTKDFAFVLAIGLLAGTYSSIFLASTLLVEVEKFSKNI